MKLTIIHQCETDDGLTIPVGTEVEYLGHVPGGMIKVRVPVKYLFHIGTMDCIINPATTDKL